MDEESDDIQELRNEIKRLLAAALESDAKRDAEIQRRNDSYRADTARRDELHDAEMQRRDDVHLAETERRDELHIAELGRRNQLHVEEMALLAAAIESRDLIGQAKGVIMVTVGCSADEAFNLLKAQSQHENRKVVEVAAEIAARAQRKDTSGWSESGR
jgi:ANTAR domain